MKHLSVLSSLAGRTAAGSGGTHTSRLGVDIKHELAVEQRLAERVAPDLLRVVADRRAVREAQALDLPVVLLAVDLDRAQGEQRVSGSRLRTRARAGVTHEKDVLLVRDAVERDQDEHAHAVRLLAHPEAEESPARNRSQ